MKTHFTLDIRLGNDAMRTGEDVGSALHGVAGRLEESYAFGKLKGLVGLARIILDPNGDEVGHWVVVKQPSADEILQRVLEETPDGAAFDLNAAILLAVKLARGGSAS